MNPLYPSPLKRRALVGFAVCALLGGLAACSDQPPPTSPATAEPVANAPASAFYMPSPHVQLRTMGPRASASVLASPPTSRACTQILVYDNNSHYAHARNAVTEMGLSFTRAVAADFSALLASQTWDLVIMDLPSTEPDGAWQTGLVAHITAGGRAIHTHWNPSSLTPSLLEAFQVSNPVAHATQSFFEWRAGPLFIRGNAVPITFDVWADVWGTNGFLVEATGSAVAAAGFTSAPAPGQAAIVMGNNRRSIFNGFLFDDYEPADKDGDGQKDIEELIQNEVELVCKPGGGH